MKIASKYTCLYDIIRIVFLLPLLNSCVSYHQAGIIEWTYKDELLDWKDVKNASYYEIEFFQTDQSTKEAVMPLQPLPLGDYKTFAYASHYSFYGLAVNQTYNVKVKVYYEDGTTDESDLINISHEVDFPYPTQLGFGAYVGDVLSWTDMSDSNLNLINYTLKINDDSFDLDNNIFNMDSYDGGVYKFQVKANYETGSSEWTKPYYAAIRLSNDEGNMLQANYDCNSGKDFTYTLDSDKDIIAVIGKYYIYSYRAPLPEEIVTIDGSKLTLNHYYLEAENAEPQSIIMQIYIITEDTPYTLYILNETSND